MSATRPEGLSLTARELPVQIYYLTARICVNEIILGRSCPKAVFCIDSLSLLRNYSRMARHKDVQWIMPEGDSWQTANLATLMDIRDELKALNRLLHCHRFMEIPWKLDAIVKNTTKKQKLKLVKKKNAA